MKKRNHTEIVFIIDKSGSMHHLKEDTIGSFNDLISKQKIDEGDANITTVLFNNRIDILHSHEDVYEVEDMTRFNYRPSGGTALLDAVGYTIRNMKNYYNDFLKEERPEQVLFVIITDGMENSSIHYTYNKVKRDIENCKRRYDWEFLFIGANIDAVNEGAKFGIDRKRTVRFHADRRGSQAVYENVNATISDYRRSSKVSDDWAKDIEKDFNDRR
jgi:uncharacterized protein with von Willebrand factor type A (vWA) domain